jgi:GrpB-like predicted nucleotidyltransferase (UPF0157 family)
MAGSEPTHLDDELERVLVHGMHRVRPQISDPDPEWPLRFERERGRIGGALGDRLLLIEHIGSTAVPGLAAKPVVDIVIVVADPDDEAAYVPALAGLGYEMRVREPGHRVLKPPASDVNLHVCAPGVPEIDAWLTLRDHLRRDGADRERYAALKRDLAQREWRDMNYYADAKGPLIREMLERARGESR